MKTEYRYKAGDKVRFTQEAKHTFQSKADDQIHTVKQVISQWIDDLYSEEKPYLYQYLIFFDGMGYDSEWVELVERESFFKRIFKRLWKK